MVWPGCPTQPRQSGIQPCKHHSYIRAGPRGQVPGGHASFSRARPHGRLDKASGFSLCMTCCRCPSYRSSHAHTKATGRMITDIWHVEQCCWRNVAPTVWCMLVLTLFGFGIKMLRSSRLGACRWSARQYRHKQLVTLVLRRYHTAVQMALSLVLPLFTEFS